MSYNLVDPTTGDLTRVAGIAGSSIPVGTLIQQYKKKPISGYLYCDGSTFDQNVYPALYTYLGTNVLPDYRECVMVGAEQNTTDTIATHDVYTEGEFKDDQLQGHRHEVSLAYSSTAAESSGAPVALYKENQSPLTSGHTGAVGTIYRSGETTHGKQKAVYVYIKATSGIDTSIIPSDASASNKLVTESDLNSKGVFKGYIEPNKKLTISMDPYSEVYGYVQVEGSASIPFRLHNAALNATPAVFLKKSVTINEENVYVDKPFGTTVSIGPVTIANTNGVWTITNASTETESYWVGGGVNSVSLGDA